MSDKIENLYFKENPRTKRGLINFGGTISKWPFGTLDADDGDKYDKILFSLKENQQKIDKQVNSQISLSEKLIDKFSKSIETIINNQRKISDYIDRVYTSFN